MPPDGFEAGRGWAPNEVLINGRAFFRATTLPTIYIYLIQTLQYQNTGSAGRMATRGHPLVARSANTPLDYALAFTFHPSPTLVDKQRSERQS